MRRWHWAALITALVKFNEKDDLHADVADFILVSQLKKYRQLTKWACLLPTGSPAKTVELTSALAHLHHITFLQTIWNDARKKTIDKLLTEINVDFVRLLCARDFFGSVLDQFSVMSTGRWCRWEWLMRAVSAAVDSGDAVVLEACRMVSAVLVESNNRMKRLWSRLLKRWS